MSERAAAEALLHTIEAGLAYTRHLAHIHLSPERVLHLGREVESGTTWTRPFVPPRKEPAGPVVAPPAANAAPVPVAAVPLEDETSYDELPTGALDEQRTAPAPRNLSSSNLFGWSQPEASNAASPPIEDDADTFVASPDDQLRTALEAFDALSREPDDITPVGLDIPGEPSLAPTLLATPEIREVPAEAWSSPLRESDHNAPATERVAPSIFTPAAPLDDDADEDWAPEFDEVEAEPPYLASSIFPDPTSDEPSEMVWGGDSQDDTFAKRPVLEEDGLSWPEMNWGEESDASPPLSDPLGLHTAGPDEAPVMEGTLSRGAWSNESLNDDSLNDDSPNRAEDASFGTAAPLRPFVFAASTEEETEAEAADDDAAPDEAEIEGDAWEIPSDDAPLERAPLDWSANWMRPSSDARNDDNIVDDDDDATALDRPAPDLLAAIRASDNATAGSSNWGGMGPRFDSPRWDDNLSEEVEPSTLAEEDDELDWGGGDEDGWSLDQLSKDEDPSDRSDSRQLEEPDDAPLGLPRYSPPDEDDMELSGQLRYSDTEAEDEDTDDGPSPGTGIFMRPPTAAQGPAAQVPAIVQKRSVWDDVVDDDADDTIIGSLAEVMAAAGRTPRTAQPRVVEPRSETLDEPSGAAAIQIIGVGRAQTLTPTLELGGDPGEGDSQAIQPVYHEDDDEDDGGMAGFRLQFEEPEDDTAEPAVPMLTDDEEQLPSRPALLSADGLVLPASTVGLTDNTSASTIRDFVEKAEAAERKGNLREAVLHYDDLLSHSPQNIAAHLGRGRCLVDLGDYGAAMSDFTRAEDIAPESPEPLVEMGNLFFARKEYKRAITYYNHAIDLDANHAMAYSRRGISHYYRRQYSEAHHDLIEAEKRDSSIPGLQRYIQMASRKLKKQR